MLWGVVVKRRHQAVLILSTVLGSWLGMQAVHEAGHVLGAWLTGGQVARVVLHPLTISRTDASHDRHPLLVVWGGPILGSVLPLIVLGITRLIRSGSFYLFQFFAGFCLVANGAYVGVGSFGGVGDAGDLMRYGAPGWTLIVSNQPYQEKYDPKEKAKTFGAYNYDSKYDLVRVPMKMVAPQVSIDQFTIAFVDMAEKGGKLAMAWEKTGAVVPFAVVP